MCFTVFLNKVDDDNDDDDDDDDDPKTFILFMSKIWDFFLPYLWPKIQHPIYNRCGWHSAPNIIYEGLFDDGLFDNDEKTISPGPHILICHISEYPQKERGGS